VNAPTETEIKLVAAPAMLDALTRHPLLAGEEIASRLVNTWFDTADGALQRAGATLRVRDTGRGLEQTLKLASRNGPARIEWTVPSPGPCPDDVAFPPKARRRLARLTGNNALSAVATALVERCERTVEWQGATIKAAFDRGEIIAGDAREPISELELEIASGPVHAALALAGELPLGPELMWSGRTKAGRAYALAHGGEDRQSFAQARLAPSMPAAAAFRAIAWAILGQLLSTYPRVIDDGSPDGVHQTRVALRRLRSAIRLFAPVLPADRAKVLRAAFGTAARGLGPARDLYVLADAISSRIDPRDGESEAVLSHLLENLATATADAQEILASTPFQRLLCEFAMWVEHPEAAPAEDTGEALHSFAGRAFSRLRRRLVRHGQKLGDMTETVRHEVRKDAKQLRYAIGFLDGAWPKAHRREQRSRFTRQLTRLQDSLGALNDLAVASASRDTMFATCDPITAARLGARLESLLSSQSESQARLLRRADKALDRIATSPPWWKQG